MTDQVRHTVRPVYAAPQALRLSRVDAGQGNCYYSGSADSDGYCYSNGISPIGPGFSNCLESGIGATSVCYFNGSAYT